MMNGSNAPCSAILFPTSYLSAGFSIRYGPVLLSCGALSSGFNTSAFASSIAFVDHLVLVVAYLIHLLQILVSQANA